jgi:3-methylcrotonyl-CoA carboxylase alpha subunit
MAVATLRCGEQDHRVETHPDRVLVDGVETAPSARAVAIADGDTRWVYVDGELYEFEVQQNEVRRTAAHQGSLSAPMPATVRKINVQPGAVVKKGDTLLVLEAMKMELPVRAPSDGIVQALTCREGELVQPGVVLVELS